MNSLEGKKLLILGGSENEITLVLRAKEKGVYTIVADYYKDYEISPAKRYANEVWDVSWNDLDILEKMCREAHVDGVVAGYSEFRVESMINLCQRLGLPSYCTMEQLEITRNKRLFKDTCIANGVPVIHEYKSVDEVTSYPVIVKPVDRGGSIGISVASNREELEKSYAYAMEMSVVKDVIIEDFIQNATKIDMCYGAVDGQIFYMGCTDTVHAAANGIDKVVQSCWLIPSRHQPVILEKADAPIKRMLKSIGVQNGYIFISGFANNAGDVAIFETGFRMSGGHLYDYYEANGYPNTYDIFIYYALTGDCKHLLEGCDLPDAASMKFAALNLYAKKGIISTIAGLEEAKNIPQCGLVLQNARVGQVCTDDKAILSKIAMVQLWCDDPIELKSAVEKAYDLISVTGENGEDMIYDRINAEIIPKWWD